MKNYSVFVLLVCLNNACMWDKIKKICYHAWIMFNMILEWKSVYIKLIIYFVQFLHLKYDLMSIGNCCNHKRKSHDCKQRCYNHKRKLWSVLEFPQMDIAIAKARFMIMGRCGVSSYHSFRNYVSLLPKCTSAKMQVMTARPNGVIVGT